MNPNVEGNDVAMIDRVIREIRADNEQLAGRLTELADDSAYDKILDLVGKKE